MDGFDSRRLHHFDPVDTGSIHYHLLCFPYLSLRSKHRCSMAGLPSQMTDVGLNFQNNIFIVMFFYLYDKVGCLFTVWKWRPNEAGQNVTGYLLRKNYFRVEGISE